jgi:hypothetical protein
MRYPTLPMMMAGLVAGCGNEEPTGLPVIVAAVSVVPDTARIARAGQVAFSAVARDADGAVISGRPVSWTVSNEAIAKVSASGVATGVGPGIANVTATVDGEIGLGVLVVEAAPPLSVRDDFDRADGPLGPSWMDGSNNLAIQSGEVGLTSLAGSSLARWVADVFRPDQFSEVVVGTLEGNSFDFFRGLQAFIRMQLQGTPWRYGCHYFSNTLTYQIKYDGGPTAETRVLDETPQEPLPVTGDRIRIEAVGDTIQCYVNDQLKLQTVDGALTDGAIGFVVGLNPGATELPRRIVASWTGGER